MYTAPNAINGVYFTKNLSEKNYNQGISMLGYFFRAWKANSLQFISIQGLEDYLETNYPTFIEYLGEQVSQMGTTPVINAMQLAASKMNDANETYYPRPSNFSNAFIDLYGTGISYTQVIEDTGVEVVKTIGAWSLNISLFFIVGAVIYLGIESGIIKKLLESTKKAKR